jgi:hypothetical protein
MVAGNRKQTEQPQTHWSRSARQQFETSIPFSM